MNLSTIDQAGIRLAVPASSCASRPAIVPVALVAAGYSKQVMAGGVVGGHIQDATGRFWDPVGPPPSGRSPR